VAVDSKPVPVLRTDIFAQYEHFLWKELGATAKSSSHGGEDFVELHQFVTAVRNKIQTPVDVYDAATWSVIVPLSVQSVASKSAAVDFPGFHPREMKKSAAAQSWSVVTNRKLFEAVVFLERLT
jgi:hypothetical protein